PFPDVFGAGARQRPHGWRAGCPRSPRSRFAHVVFAGNAACGKNRDMDEQAVREIAEDRLRALAGEQDELREDEWSSIRALVVERRRTLVVQRTGWGIFAVYFLTTALLREFGEGPTLIVSPLLALMRNQVAAAASADVQ